MPESNLSFFGRLSLAVGTFFSVLGNREFAAGVLRVRDGAQEQARRRGEYEQFNAFHQ